MPNVVRGSRMSGLMMYLAGPGRHNEHTEPHLVAGDSALMTWYDDNELGRDAALAIARHLDEPRRVLGIEVDGGHVWHCSLSLRAEEGLKTDEEWAAIARDFVTEMGFDDPDDARAPCRWVAVRHGVSSNGNDHIHIAVNLVREDGTKAAVWNDFSRAQKAARALEVRHGLEQLESARTQRATRGYDPAEREAQARGRARAAHERVRRTDRALPTWDALPAAERHAQVAAQTSADQPRHALARVVRGCATAAADEGEFVRRMRRAGVLVRPRYAEGTTDVITGYSVAARPQYGERPIWYGGRHLGRDLSLPRLREEWPDDPAAATAAAAEWNAAKRQRRPVAPGRETSEFDPAAWGQYTEHLAAVREQLRAVPVQDREAWARLARHSAGALAEWSRALEDVPGPIAAAADTLSRSAQTRRPPQPAPASSLPSIAGAALLLASASRSGHGAVAEAAMVRQLMKLVLAVAKMHEAARELRQAQAVRDQTLVQMERLTRDREQRFGFGDRVAQVEVNDPELAASMRRREAARAGLGPAGSPIPTPIEPAPHRPVAPGPKRPGPRR
nr:relaxase/mobilization nuclease domain-containing protein [Actinotalea ferrariae]